MPSDGLKGLLRHFAGVCVTLNYLAGMRPSWPDMERPGENFTSTPDLLPGEPALVVKISGDGETRISQPTPIAEGGQLSVMELPEDEFWFFEAFRPAFSNLTLELPLFLYEMALVNLYAVFDGFIADVIRGRLRRYPRLMGADRQLRYAEIFEAGDKSEILELMIEREVRNVMFRPLPSVLVELRTRYGLRRLADVHDQIAYALALTRNCLLHNNGLVDAKLAEADSMRRIGTRITLGEEDINAASETLRKLAYTIDQANTLAAEV